MKTHRNLTLGLFACLFLLGSCTDNEIVDQKTGGSIATKAVANTDVILHWNTEEQNIEHKPDGRIICMHTENVILY